MARKRGKPNSPSEVVGRVASALIECPLTVDEIRTLEKIERRRQEADVDMRVAITPDQRTKAYDKAAKAGEAALELARKVANRIEGQRSAEIMREIDQLAQIRGDELEESSTGARRRVSPLMRLHRAKLITDEEYGGLMRYGTTWQRLYWAEKGNGTGNGELDPMDGRIADLKRLDAARGYSIAEAGGKALVASGLGGDARLIKLCDDVCGREMSLREVVLGSPSGDVLVKHEHATAFEGKRKASGHKRKVAMERLKRAGGLLALHYGLIRTREDDLQAA